MDDLKPLGLNANAWQFLGAPDRYVASSVKTQRPLVAESTRRQFVTARDILTRLNGSHGIPARKGVLLADDVGLGKTTVGALVAWVVARSGDATRNVRILAPNETLRRRWADELTSHLPMLSECAPHLLAEERHLHAQSQKLHGGRIHVTTHHHALDGTLNCDLLIVDEAHRAKGEQSRFSRELRSKNRSATRILILTATPFSIDITELGRMLALAGADEVVRKKVKSYGRTLDRLFAHGVGQDADKAGAALAERAEAAVRAIQPFVIRHGVDDLKKEHKAFGTFSDWNIPVRAVQPRELELMLRTDRLLRTAREERGRTNDARFHVGWRQLDEEVSELRSAAGGEATDDRAEIVRHQVAAVDGLRRRLDYHPKMRAVAEEVARSVGTGEKVVVFCHHHATAREFALELEKQLPEREVASSLGHEAWREAWDAVLWSPTDTEGTPRDLETLRATFISWLSSDLIRAQVGAWLPSVKVLRASDLARSLRAATVKGKSACPTVADAASDLLRGLVHSASPSTVAVLRAAGKTKESLALLPGYLATIIATCSDEGTNAPHLFLRNNQPDTLLQIFNSPFGVDVLVTTDALSEGIDLHRYCRHLVHYELDASPIRTVQRNGRVRRVNSWAAITGEPIRYAYPAFGGTRDHRLVQIMRKRMDVFGLLLGGIPSFDVDQIATADEAWRQRVIDGARARMSKLNGLLTATSSGADRTRG